MGGILNKPPDASVTFVARIANIFKNNFRGLIGVIIPLLTLPWFLSYLKFDRTVLVVWLTMFWFLLLQPVAIPVVSVVPLFSFPILGVMNSNSCCICCFSCGIAFLIIGGYVHMLLNNSDCDRRIILSLICPNKASETLNKIALVVKVSVAAYVTSVFSNRLLATKKLMEHISDALLPYADDPKVEGQASCNSMRHILANAIATSSCIGSIAIVHSSYAVLAFRALFYDHMKFKQDHLNFLEYSMFAIPTSLFMFAVNLVYNIVLMVIVCKGEVEKTKAIAIRNSLNKAKDDISNANLERKLHEGFSAFFLALLLIAYFTRSNRYFGWSNFRLDKESKSPTILDSTVASIFVLFLHIVPRTYHFLTYFKPNHWTKSTAPAAKAESAVLFFKFVDKSTVYGYLFLTGAGIILTKGIIITKLSDSVKSYGKFLTGQSWPVEALLLCIISVFLSNIMTSMGALIMILPFVLTMQEPIYKEVGSIVNTNMIRYLLGPLAVGIGVNFGFAGSFLFTPPHFSNTVAKVPMLTQIKYSIGSTLICCLILWIMISFYAPLVFGHAYVIASLTKTTVTTTTTTTTLAPPPPPPPEPPGP